MVIRSKKLIFLAALTLIAASLACNLPGRYLNTVVNTQPVPVTTEAVESLKENTQSAAEEALKTGNITLVFDETQLTSLAAFELSSLAKPSIQDPQIRLRDGQIQVSGKVQQNNLALPLTAVVTVAPDEIGQPHFSVESASLGPLGLPQSFLDQMSAQLDQLLIKKLSDDGQNIFIEKITISDGKMTITGHTK